MKYLKVLTACVGGYIKRPVSLLTFCISGLKMHFKNETIRRVGGVMRTEQSGKTVSGHLAFIILTVFLQTQTLLPSRQKNLLLSYTGHLGTLGSGSGHPHSQ